MTFQTLRRSLVVAVFVAAAAIVSLPQGAQAQSRAAVILTVDSQRIFSESLAAQSVREQRDAFIKAYQPQIEQMKEQFQSEATALEQQKTLLSPDVFDRRAQEFGEKWGESERKIQQRQKELTIALREADEKIKSALEPILKELVQKRGGTILLDKSLIVYSTSDSEIDITDEAIAQLNRVLPSVTVEMPAIN